jgi:hypothetical protein
MYGHQGLFPSDWGFMKQVVIDGINWFTDYEQDWYDDAQDVREGGGRYGLRFSLVQLASHTMLEGDYHFYKRMTDVYRADGNSIRVFFCS